MSKKMIIQKVWINKNNLQKAVTVPKNSGIEPDDYVIIEKVKHKDLRKKVHSDSPDELCTNVKK
jgi:hypothetical protein